MDTRKPRITIVIGQLSCGGAERNAISMADLLSQQGLDITLLHRPSSNGEPFFSLPPAIKKATFTKSAVKDCCWYNWLAIKQRNREFQKCLLQAQPDIVISFLDLNNVQTLIALKNDSIPVIVCERTHPGFHPINWRWNLLRQWTYPRASRVVLQSHEIEQWVHAKNYRWQCSVIPNPVYPPPIYHNSKPDKNRKAITALGRLEAVKQFDHLIKAFEAISNEFPKWDLNIYGMGTQYHDLAEMIKLNKLTERVYLKGATKSPYRALAESDLFVMTSAYEGFPNALAEAMAVGLPVISYDCPGGPQQLIHHEQNGLLVKSNHIENLIQAMRRLIADGNLRERYGSRAKEVVKRFHPQKIYDMWEELIYDVLSREKK